VMGTLIFMVGVIYVVVSLFRARERATPAG
jgi:uncharacterized membrane protein YtjA (UPF0391 family)